MTAAAMNRYASYAQDALVSTVDPVFSWLVPTFFGPVRQFETEFIEYDIVEGGIRIAPFASPLSLGKATRDLGYRTFQLRPAYIKLLDTVRPQQGFTRVAGEQYGGSLSPQDRLARAVAEKIALHRQMIETRWEQMASDVLFAGQLVITDDDYPRAVVDFERDPNLAMTVGTAWSDVSSDPMSDIQTMADRINSSSKGTVPNKLVSRTAVYNNLLKNTKFRDSLDKNKNLSANQGQGFEATGLKSADKAPTLRGILGGQYEYWTYDGYYENDVGAAVPFVPADKMLVTSGAVEGVRYHGAILDMDAQMAAVEVFVKTRSLWNPSGEEVLSQSAPMLGMRRPNASGVITTTV